MAHRIEQLRRHSCELTERREGLREQEYINSEDLSSLRELFAVPLEDDADIHSAESLSRAIETEGDQIQENTDNNNEAINETAMETEKYIEGLTKNLSTFKQMEAKSDLVDLGEQQDAAKSDLEELEEIERMLLNADADRGKRSWAVRAGAGAAALVAGFAPEVGKIVNRYDREGAPTELVERAPEDVFRTPKQMVEQRFPGWTIAAEIGEMLREGLSDWPEDSRRRRENKERNAAAGKPEFADMSD